MAKRLFKVTFINQETGDEIVDYVLADSIKQVDDEYADLMKLEPLHYTKIPEDFS